MTTVEINKILLLAKIKSSKLANDYVIKISNGFNSEEKELNKIKYIKSLISSIELYMIRCKDLVLSDGIIIDGNSKVIMSRNNSLYLQSKEQEIRLGSDDQNCLNNEQICKMIRDLRSITSNC